MEFIEQQPYYDIENPAHRAVLSRLAIAVSRDKLIHHFWQSAFGEGGKVSANALSVINGTSKVQGRPDKSENEQLRRKAVARIHILAQRMISRPIPQQKGNLIRILSDDNMGLSRTEQRRLTDTINALEREGKKTMIITGSEIGICINSAVDKVRTVAPRLTQVTVRDLCRHGRFSYNYPEVLTIHSESIRTPPQIRVFFGMTEGKRPDLEPPPRFLTKRI